MARTRRRVEFGISEAGNGSIAAKVFFEELKAWSVIKHKILSPYLKLLLGKIGGNVPVAYVDGFAGCGRYDDGSDGSPLIAARLARDPQMKSREGRLACINVEKNQSNFRNLQEHTREFAEFVTNLNMSFDDALPGILKMVTGKAAFFFIDPFGADGIDVSVLKRIAERKETTEAFVRFDSTTVKRLIGAALNNLDSEDPVKRKRAYTTLSTAQQLSDESAWDEILADSGSRDLILRSYETLIKRDTDFSYALSYDICNPANGAHKYYLTHFCKHVDGYTHMARFMAAQDREFQAQRPQQFQLFEEPHYSLPEQKEENIKKVAEFLESKWIGWRGKTMRMREIRRIIVQEFGWRYTESEWNGAVKKLKGNNVIRSYDGTKDGSMVTFT